MDCTSSSERTRPLPKALRSALEGLALAAAAAGVLRALLPRDLAREALKGLGAAWAVSTLSVAALLFARESSGKAFWRAYGAGLAARAAVFIGLLASVRGLSWNEQAARLLAYAFGVLVFLLLEYRNLTP